MVRQRIRVARVSARYRTRRCSLLTEHPNRSISLPSFYAADVPTDVHKMPDVGTFVAVCPPTEDPNEYESWRLGAHPFCALARQTAVLPSTLCRREG